MQCLPATEPRNETGGALARADDATRAFCYTVLFAVLVALGLIHYALIAGRFDRSWVKYLFVALDIAIVSALIATRPLFPTAADLPAVTMFRAPMFPFYFVILNRPGFSGDSLC